MPLGFLTPHFIANGSSLIIPNANLYEFGVLSSVVSPDCLNIDVRRPNGGGNGLIVNGA